MNSVAPQTIYLKDYKPTPFLIDSVSLDVWLDPTETHVKTAFAARRRESGAALSLDGEGLRLVSIRVDGVELTANEYELSDKHLTLRPVQDECNIEIEQICDPQGNTELSGLYMSNGMFCTQMEAEGFRRFAYFYDRPDVMARYRVRLEAPQSFPVLLCNGNHIESGTAGGDRHYAIWDDPHPKPTYLFALVAGKLASLHDGFITMSGRDVKLGIYVEEGKQDRCDWAMQSLKASMRWDEERFGREYDLDVFNIVAVSDFNMGAMENKGLNIFNDKYILARPDTATDLDYLQIEAIIAHEYFHNWTGNRITCRDWFQLCLKEGLTVFRDQEFTSDMRSRAVKRIQDVRTLRARQFPEDQGPLSHPVRPSSYIEINNFYTPTVYEKGAEICRMMQTVIGRDAFRKAMDIYFDRHDGDAATVEDFIRCMEDASGRDLAHFSKWYEQSGTPNVRVSSKHDARSKTLTLTVTQATAGNGEEKKLALNIPLTVGLMDRDGRDIELCDAAGSRLNTPVLELTEASQQFVFGSVANPPVVSINRSFTAPVVLQTDASEDDLLCLLGHDSDSFNRWEAAQTLARALILNTIATMKAGNTPVSTERYAAALRNSLIDDSLDDALKALLLTLPPEAEIAASLGGDADSDLVFKAREHVKHQIAAHMKNELLVVMDETSERGAYAPDQAGTGRRSLRYACLALLATCDTQRATVLARADFEAANSMTAETGAVSAILAVDGEDRSSLLDEFYQRHHGDPLLIDKWLLMNAQIPGEKAYHRIEALLGHKDFTFHTPNRVYALLGGFTGGNLSGFNAAHGEGYRLVADCIVKIDQINPQVASRIATGFRSWHIFDSTRRLHAKTAMERILSVPNLSQNVFEIISKTNKMGS
jgi:aminopeptidase N